jgi:glycogen synthase
MKVLFVGPYPPPHGGISVHVWSAHTRMKRAGQQSSVLNIDPRAPESDRYIKISGGMDLIRQLVRHVGNDWMLNVYINGHNPKSWAIAAVCGVAAQFGPGATLMLHSGMAPGYICNAPNRMRQVIRLVCALYRQIICVNDEIATAVADLGIPKEQIQITPAFLPIETPEVVPPPEIESWMRQHSPVMTSTMFFRTEYGFEVLLDAVGRLRDAHPQIGCLVMGTGEGREQAAELVERQGLIDQIFLAGDLDHELCLALMARSAVFVRPTFRDGDSISVREAVSLGVQVIASNVGTRPDGVLLFEPGDVNGLVARIEQVCGESVCGKAYSPPREEGWLRHQEDFGEAILSAADGVVAHETKFSVSDHPGRSK